MAGQFYIVDATEKNTGFSAPVAAITWARVSAETDRRLTETVGHPIRLRPDEWTGGDVHWLIHVAGHPNALEAGLRHLAANQLKGRSVKMMTRAENGQPQIQGLHELIARTGVI